MGKKIRNFIGFFVVLLLFTGCSSVELNVKEENVKVTTLYMEAFL